VAVAARAQSSEQAPSQDIHIQKLGTCSHTHYQ
jgi:hypothetical protein